jgi:predicted AlkP superfamily pyrophosphatase or phosphodiesterase
VRQDIVIVFDESVAVINVVGLTAAMIDSNMPHLAAFAARRQLIKIQPAFPAVTCTAQATYLTGATPVKHGIVGNGWFDRELAEIHFWKQSNRLDHLEPSFGLRFKCKNIVLGREPLRLSGKRRVDAKRPFGH